MADNPFEIPQALRQVSEQNVKQARAAYEQLMEFMTKAMGPWMGTVPSNPMTAGLQHMQDRAMQIAMENAESASALVEKISKAQNFQDVFGLQSRFALEQMKAYAGQTQELQKLIGETLQKLQHG